MTNTLTFKKINIKFFLLFFCSLFFISFTLHANVTRRNIIDYNLDYCERQQTAVEKGKVVQEENEAVLTEKKKVSADIWKKRKERINKLLDSMLYTFSYKIKYDDNLNNTNGGQEKDTSTLAVLNVDYVPKSSSRNRNRKTDIFIDYQGKGLGMSTGDEVATNAHFVKFGIAHEITDKYSINADYQGSNSKIETDSGLNKEYSYEVDQTYSAGFHADWGRFPWSFDYSYNRVRHEKEFKTSDTNATVFDFTGTFKISLKTDFIYGYTMGESENPHALDNDYTWEKYNIGLRGKIAPKLTGIARIGWGTFKYVLSDSDVEERAFTLNYRPLSRLMMSFAVNSRIRASTFGTTDASKQLSLGVRFRYLPPFNKRLTLTSKIVSTTTDMSDSNRSDEAFEFNLGADYGLNKWVKLGLLYEFDSVESNSPLNEYEKNVISLTGTFEF